MAAQQPGRILDLRCGACWALFRWDKRLTVLEIVKGRPKKPSRGLREDWLGGLVRHGDAAAGPRPVRRGV
jgi:hypothetical protein